MGLTPRSGVGPALEQGIPQLLQFPYDGSHLGPSQAALGGQALVYPLVSDMQLELLWVAISNPFQGDTHSNGCAADIF